MKVGERLTFEGLEYEAVPNTSGSCEGCAAYGSLKLCVLADECDEFQVKRVDTPNDIKNISPDHLTNEN